VVTKKKKKVIKKISKKFATKTIIKKKSKVRGIAKVGGISLLTELKDRLKRGREYLFKEAERILKEVTNPANWYNAVRDDQNVAPTFVWRINKERIYSKYKHKYYKTFDNKGNEVRSSEPPHYDSSLCMSRPIEELIMVLPEGKIITPIRQYCEHKVLPTGTREAFFYNFHGVAFPSTSELDSPVITEPTITSSRAELEPYGTRLDISYQKLEESSTTIIEATNTAFALESVNDENVAILDRVFDNSTLPKEHWVNGNTGEVITSDKDLKETDVLTLKGILKAKGKIQEQGLDDSNLVLYTTGKGIRDLVLDPDLDSYIGFSKPAIITEETLERICGINIIRSGAVPNTPQIVEETIPIPETYWKRFKRVLLFKKQPTKTITHEIIKGYHSCLFIPNISFGLVTGEDITMEAQRRNELQAISQTGTQRVSGVLKVPESTVRLSHV